MPISSTIWNKNIEMMPIDQLRLLQLYRLRNTVQYVYDNSSYYRAKLDERGVRPEHIKTLEDVRLLPFTTKYDLRDNYPDGIFSAPREKLVRYHVSSGTTGKPTVVGCTKHDVDMWTECVTRALGCAGCTSKDTLQVSYGYGLFTGGLGLHQGGENLGMTVIPASSGNTNRQLMLMQDLQPTMLCCTPSYALYLGEALHKQNIDMKRIKLRVGAFGAEPWTEEMRGRIEELLHIDALDIYGLSETAGPGVAMECIEAKHGLHFWEDNFLFEILNPETLEPVPEGEFGELVVTTLNKTGMPTLRYRTRDITRIIPEPCVCGRTHRRIDRLRGRSDDMLIIRGVNVFPTQIEAAFASVEGIMPHYQLIVDRVNNLDTLEVQVELSAEMPADEVRKIEALRSQLEKSIHSVLGLAVNVTLLQPNTIPRSEGKAKRVIDRRHVYEAH